MTMFNADVELNEQNVSDTRALELQKRLSAYHPSIGQSPRGWLDITITFPAENLRQATETALALIEGATGGNALRAEVMTEKEFDARQGFQHVPEMVSAAQAGTMLAKTHMRILQMIDEGKFLTATKIGKTWAIALSEVEAKVER